MCRREQRIRWILIFYTAILLQKHGSYYTFYEQSTEMASCWGQSHKGKCSEVTLQQNNRIIQAWSWWARCSHSLSYFFIMRSVSCRGDSAVILNLSQLTHTHIIKNNKKNQTIPTAGFLFVCFCHMTSCLPSIYSAAFPLSFLENCSNSKD